MELIEFGGMVRSARLARNMTQLQLAAAAGLSRATISALESGKIQELGFTRINTLSRLLGMELKLRTLASAEAMPEIALESALLQRLQKRYIWWKLPGIEPDPLRVIAQVMNLGTHADVKTLEMELGRMRMKQALTSAEPGWFSPQSWAFWHIALGLAVFDAIPPQPRREHDLQARFQDAAGEPISGLAAP